MSTPSAPAVTSTTSQPPTTEADSLRMILDYLDRHGHSRSANILRADIGATGGGGGRTVGLEEFADKNAPVVPKAVVGGQRKGGGQLLQDAPSWEKGYEGLRAFVDNSLDIHKPELTPILLPLFVHSYLDLVLVGYREAADHFLLRFSPDHSSVHPSLIRLLSSIRLEAHVRESEEATRWRMERYHIRLSERGWGLLLGWLQGGGLVGGVGEGTEGRGRDRVLSIINERVRVDAVPGPPSTSLTSSDLGLTSDLPSSIIPLPPTLTLPPGSKPPPKKPPPPLLELKLGLPVLDPKLEKEVGRVLKDDYTPSVVEGGVTKEEGLPYPSTLRTVDVVREVERVREGRKRIKLGTGTGEEGGEGGAGAKPSVCLFTVHDAGESLITVTFSEDSSLMAAGFSESYIRLWNLKGEPLVSKTSDNNGEATTPPRTSLKLIGHSGPIYSLSFDPLPGPSLPPKYLLSSSADSTIRLWSLETFTCLVAYRGHREPVWGVEWGPKGIYWASCGRDRTVRVWLSERVAAVRVLAGHGSDVNCIKFHPNSLYIATGSSDRTCRLWDIQKGTCVRVFVGHRGSVTCIAMSPDGKWLASGSEDLSIILWSLSTSLPHKTFLGHTSSIYSLSFSAESSILVSGSADGTVRVWDILAPPSVVKSTVVKTTVVAGLIGGGKKEDTVGEVGKESAELLVTLATKRTPVVEVHFTPRNLVLAAGALGAI